MNTVVGGLKVKPSDKVQLSVDVAYNTAEGEIDPFRMLIAEAWAAPKPNQNYDFSQTHTNSDLDTTFLEAGLEARVKVKEGMFVTGNYRYLDFTDDAPYLGDTTGSADFFGLGLGWTF